MSRVSLLRDVPDVVSDNNTSLGTGTPASDYPVATVNECHALKYETVGALDMVSGKSTKEFLFDVSYPTEWTLLSAMAIGSTATTSYDFILVYTELVLRDPSLLNVLEWSLDDMLLQFFLKWLWHNFVGAITIVYAHEAEMILISSVFKNYSSKRAE